MRRAIAVAALALPVLSGCGEKEETPYFQVLGEAKIEKQPELFRVGVKIEERSKTQQESLAAAAGKLERVRMALSELEGLEQIRIRTGDAKTRAVRPRGCDPERDYDEREYPKDCTPVEFISAIVLSIEGEPANAAGATVSLLTELGVEEADLAEFDVRNPAAAQMQARNQAVKNATEAARAMAGEAGAQLGRPLEIKYDDEDGGWTEEGTTDEDTIVVTGSRVPAHPLLLPPDVVTFEAKVTVKFALEKKQAEE